MGGPSQNRTLESRRVMVPLLFMVVVVVEATSDDGAELRLT